MLKFDDILLEHAKILDILTKILTKVFTTLLFKFPKL